MISKIGPNVKIPSYLRMGHHTRNIVGSALITALSACAINNWDNAPKIKDSMLGTATFLTFIAGAAATVGNICEWIYGEEKVQNKQKL